MKGRPPRRAKGRKKPRFVRNKGIHMKRLGKKWRRPRGIDSKMRMAIRGKPRSPKAGYGTDGKIRSLHPSGHFEVIVHNVMDLEGLDSATQAARIGGRVGLMKRESIITRARELGIKILNR